MKKSLYNYYMASGGNMNSTGWSQGIGTAATLGAGIVDASATTDDLGYQTTGATIGKTALSGAAAGATFGPWGAAIGAVVGAAAGWIKSGSDKRKIRTQHSQIRSTIAQNNANLSASRIAMDPSLVQGDKNLESYYRKGGWIKGAVNPAHKGYCTPMTKSTCTPRRKAFAMTMKKHHGFHKKALGGEVAAPLSKAYMENGHATSLSSTATYLSGRSHEQGGIDIPHLQVNLEGGETTEGNFVFSKELGFAKLHKPLAMAMGKIEKKPLTRERVAAKHLLGTRIQELMQAQESLKHVNGLNEPS